MLSNSVVEASNLGKDNFRDGDFFCRLTFQGGGGGGGGRGQAMQDFEWTHVIACNLDLSKVFEVKSSVSPYKLLFFFLQNLSLSL